MRIQIVLISVLLAACGSARLPTFTPYKVEIRQGNLITQDMRAMIKLGMTQSQVKAALGAPLINDVYHANRWDYVYRFAAQGKVTETRRVTLLFKDSKLSSVEGDVIAAMPASNSAPAASPAQGKPAS